MHTKHSLFGFTDDDRLYGGARTDTASYADITFSGANVSLALITAQEMIGTGRDRLFTWRTLSARHLQTA